jgi:Dihaem cytochrome c
MKRITVFATLAIILSASAVMAQEGGFRLPIIDHAATLKECSACHLAFQPQFLPARSWGKIMGDLSNHFGEDATLTPELQADILGYLQANAADAPSSKYAKRVLRGVQSGETPLRITELPYWKGPHGEVSAKAFKRPEIKSAANCMACHKAADKGEFYEVE